MIYLFWFLIDILQLYIAFIIKRWFCSISMVFNKSFWFIILMLYMILNCRFFCAYIFYTYIYKMNNHFLKIYFPSLKQKRNNKLYESLGKDGFYFYFEFINNTTYTCHMQWKFILTPVFMYENNLSSLKNIY